jgi:thiamine pyrophosphokinase
MSVHAHTSPDLNATEFIRIKKEKDESDTFNAVQHAVASGFEYIDIIGGIGGRLDHTVSNIQTIAHFSGSTKRITMTDETNFITIVENSTITLPQKQNCSLSLFSFSDVCSGVTTTGLQYPLENATLQNSYPIGLSNEFTSAEASIEVISGKLLVIVSSR